MVVQHLPSLILCPLQETKYLVIQTSIVGYHKDSKNRPIFRWKVLDNPLQYVGCGVWKRISQNHNPDDILLEGIRVTTCTIIPKVLDVPFVGKIPLVRLTMPLAYMPQEYSWVSEGKDKEMKWHFVSDKHDAMVMPAAVERQIPVAAPAPVPVPVPAPRQSPNPSYNIPPHLVKRFIDMAIEKGDTCPITMSPFTPGQVSMLVCGHLFETEAIRQSLRVKEQCPVCRQQATTNDIYG